MERYISFILMMFMFMNQLFSQTVSSDITFDERVHNFGTILEKNGKVSHSFVFHNRSRKLVIIDRVYSDCGCVGKLLSKASIKPGEKGVVTITFDPAYKAGFFSREIAVFFNEDKNYNHIWIEGSVKPYEHPIQEDYPYNFGNGLYLRLKVMAFGYMKPGETKQMELHYANNTGKGMTLNFVAGENKKGLKYTDPGKVESKKRGTITFYYTMPRLNDDVIIHLHPYVNGRKSAETFDLKILNANKINR